MAMTMRSLTLTTVMTAGAAIFAASAQISQAQEFGSLLKSAVKDSITAQVNEKVPYAADLKEALDKVNAMPKTWADFSQKYMSADKIKEMSDDLKTVDTSKFPTDLKEAYAEVTKSADKLYQTAEKMPDKENFASKEAGLSALKNAFKEGTAVERAGEITKELKSCYGELNDARTKLVKLAIKHMKG